MSFINYGDPLGTLKSNIDDQANNTIVPNDNLVTAEANNIKYGLSAVGDYAKYGYSKLAQGITTPFIGLSDYWDKEADESYKNVAVNNAKQSLYTNHPISDFGVKMAGWIGAGLISDGLLDTLGSSSLLGDTANGIINKNVPNTFSSASVARDVGINEYLSASGSVQLDDKGNAKFNPEDFLIGSAYGLLPLIGAHGAIRYFNRNKTRIPSDYRPSDVEATEPATPTDSDIIKNNIENKEDHFKDIPTQDLDIGGDKAVDDINNVKLSDDYDLDPTDNYATVKKAILELEDKPPTIRELDGTKRNVDINDPTENVKLQEAKRAYDDVLKTNGTYKVSLTKKLADMGIVPDKYKTIYNKLTTRAHNTFGALRDRNERALTDENAKVQEVRKEFDAGKLNLSEYKTLMNAKDEYGKTLGTLAYHSANHVVKANRQAIDTLQKLLKYRQDGVHKIDPSNYSKGDYENMAMQEALKNKDYLTNPISKGYSKVASNLKLFDDLITCLLENV